MVYRFFVSGKVQGVYFRKYTLEEAKKLKVSGWVRNLDDGRVEVLANFKDKEQFEKFLEVLKKGSPASRVEKVEYFEVEEKVEDGFEIRY